MTFAERPWDQRINLMGDIAELAYEQHATEPYARYGLNRPPLAVHALPPEIRYTPDYITETHFVEVQGHGKDQTIKLKYDKLRALHWWHRIMPVHLWLYDSTTQTATTVTLDVIDQILSSGKGEWHTFAEGTAYLAIPLQELCNAKRDPL